MGCDIHGYFERSKKGTDKKYWQPFGGRTHLGRNYGMFGKLAGVRGGVALIEPRGLPEDVGYEAKDDAYLYIDDENPDADSNTSLENALRWQKQGENIVMLDGKPFKVSHPDWHTHSWLTTAEFESCLDAYKSENPNDPTEWLADYEVSLTMMKRFEELGYEARFVFWFDN